MKYYYGIDIGGTFIKFGRFNEEFNLLRKWQFSAGNVFGDEYVKASAEAVLADMEENNIDIDLVIGIGIGCPGIILKDGVIMGAENLKLDGCSFVKLFKNYINTDIRIENDANLAALGEYYFGCGNKYKRMAFLTLGTGVGGGVIIDGKLIGGEDCSAGEFGHIRVNDNETKACKCGLYGCLEQYCSAGGIIRLAHGKFTPEEIFSAIDDENSERDLKYVAENVLTEFSSYLAKACAMISSVINPDVFIIGGGVSNAGDVILRQVRVRYKVLAYRKAKNAEFIISRLKNDAGIFGAVSLFRYINK